MDVEKFFRGASDFVAGAATIEAIPPAVCNEVAFAGRSNVGKSSLINALTHRKTLVRTSQNPGQTKQLNFFSIGGKLMLVDMPGYGFARVSKRERELWDDLIRHYLSGRPTLRRVLLLVDARRGVLEADRELMHMLAEAAVSFRVVLTKADKLTNSEREALVPAVMRELKKNAAALPEPLLTSAENNEGFEALRKELVGLI